MASSSRHSGSSSSRAGRHSSSSRPKAADVAAEAKRIYIPSIKELDQYCTYSHLFRQPLLDLQFSDHGSFGVEPPYFHVASGDPVNYTLAWQEAEQERSQNLGYRIPFISAAHERKPAGEWETNALGYEEEVARRSNLSAVLSTPAEGQGCENYPIPLEGGILSNTVVVFRGPHPTYQVLENFVDLPIISVHPTARPKLTNNGANYSFPLERDLVKNKLRAALRIALWQGYTQVVIGDFGLGNYKNPPREMAELWREVFLYDPQLRGKFQHVAFVFQDLSHSTAKLIAEGIAKSSGGRGKHKTKKEKENASSSSLSGMYFPTDFEVYSDVFRPSEIQRVLTSPDPRLGLGMITS